MRKCVFKIVQFLDIRRSLFAKFENNFVCCKTSSSPSVGRLVGRSVCWLVCHNFLKGREFALPCSSRSTCLPEIRCKPYCLNFICQVVINFSSKPKRKGSHQSFITKHQTRKVFVLQAKEGISIWPINYKFPPCVWKYDIAVCL